MFGIIRQKNKQKTVDICIELCSVRVLTETLESLKLFDFGN